MKILFLLLSFLCSVIISYSQEPGPGYTLEFDGANDHIDINKVSLLSGLTYSAWIKTSSNDASSNYTGNPALTIIGDHTNDIWNSFGVHGGLVRYLHYDGSWKNVTSSIAVNDNNWHHVAVTHNQSTNAVSIYIDGVLDSNGTITYGGGGGSLKVGFDRIGGSYFDGTNTSDFFEGSIDEVAVYGTALSQSEIRDWICKKTTPSHPQYSNLIAYYKFDDNSGSILTDSKGTNNGTLVSNPSWELSGAAIGDESIFAYSVDNSTTITLAHPNGDDMTVNVTSGTADAIQLYRIDQAPNVTTPPAGLDKISPINHWGVKTFGSAGAVYEVVYNYEGHPGINIESNLRLSSRANNSSVSWTEESATLDESVNTLTLGGQTGTQFILSSVSGNPLPVELLNFDLVKESSSIRIEWSTISEINCDYFLVQRSQDGNQWQSIENIPANINSENNTINAYSAIDKHPLIGQSYYRLKIVDTDAKFDYSDLRSVIIHDPIESNISIYPNPADNIMNVVFTSEEESQINLKIINSKGKTVFFTESYLSKGVNSISVSIDNLSPGLYNITIIRDNKFLSKKLMVY